MASRQEEKEARRIARLEAEAKEAAAASRTRRLQLVFGGVIGVAIIVGVVIAIGAAGSKHKKGSHDPIAPTKIAGVTLPAQKVSDPTAAATAAGCKISNPPDEGRNHINKTFTAADYNTNPPTSGNHFPVWAQDGVYTQKTEPQLGEMVHTLEHGRIDVQYKPGTSPELVKKLETFVDEKDDGYHMLLFPNQTNMPYQLAATAWDWSLTCPTVKEPAIWDALRTFRDAHIDKGPEKVP